jgi:hypothetical protein
MLIERDDAIVKTLESYRGRIAPSEDCIEVASRQGS